MSRNLQGITFGFFEDLPTDDKHYLEDILYGSKAHSVKIELPWEEDVQCTSPQEKPPPVVEASQPPACPLPSVIPHVLKVPDGTLAGEVASGGGDVMHMPAAAAAAPPGLHQRVYPIPVQVPPNMIPMMGVYQQSNVPISYVPVLPPQGVIIPPPAMPPQDHVVTASSKLPASGDDEQLSDSSSKVQEKESVKILAGKTYERRNKKKRPANYYETLERKQVPENPVAKQEMGPLQVAYASVVGHGEVTAPSVTSAGVVCQTVVNVQFPPPIPTSQQHDTSLVTVSQETGVPGVIIPQASHSAHYECPVSLNQTFPAAPSAMENQCIPGVPISQNAVQEHVKPSIPDVQSSDASHGINTSVSSEIYTDGRRTDASQFTFNNFADRSDIAIVRDKGLDNNAVKSDITFGSVTMSDDIPNVVSEHASVEKSPPTSCDHAVTIISSEQQHAGSVMSSVLASSKSTAPVTGSISQAESSTAQVSDASSVTETGDLPNVNNSMSSGSEPRSPISAPGSSTSTAQPPPKPKSWAGLFQNSNAASTVIYNNVPAPSSDGATTKKQATKLPETVTPDKDVAIEQLGAFLKNYQLCYKPPALQPRGLVNKGNWCYVNATLQALVACAPFCNLMRSLPAPPLLQRGATSTPVLDSIIEFINEFSAMPAIKPLEKNNKGKGNIKHDLPTGPTFEPTYVYKMLQVIKYDGFKGGKQEDAEEFLSCLLNGLHDEMVAAMKVENAKKPNDVITDVTSNGKAESTKDDLSEDELVDDAGWEQVGPKNKSVVTRSASFEKSPISEIFRGQIRNILNRQGVKESATLQPFFTLQLEIQPNGVHTVQEALNNLVSKEQLQDFTCSKTKMEVDASRRTLLEELPAILLLHLKCFVYDKNGGCQKVVKQLDFSAMLDIHKDLLSAAARSHYPPAQRRYKLFAVVKHIGVRAAGGHYVADIYHQSLGEWVHYDDNNVHVVSLPQVFKFRHPRVPYLLYYRRADLS